MAQSSTHTMNEYLIPIQLGLKVRVRLVIWNSIPFCNQIFFRDNMKKQQIINILKQN